MSSSLPSFHAGQGGEGEKGASQERVRSKEKGGMSAQRRPSLLRQREPSVADCGRRGLCTYA